MHVVHVRHRDDQPGPLGTDDEPDAPASLSPSVECFDKPRHNTYGRDSSSGGFGTRDDSVRMAFPIFAGDLSGAKNWTLRLC
ncbi:MAG: hypothetical protein A2289_09775 [Deltaproteobacteria bacterium RIFOXYA12_FULL_58_15]|nr:MAG: hypothetical protein A2289_09775 [Deltaproteobacteria bacterium RIFOXYA12_FULL_58_15]